MAYRMTAARRVALRKAQLASARKRRSGKRRRVNKKVAIGVGVGVLAVGAARHKLSGSQVQVMFFKNRPGTYTGKPNFGGFMHTNGGAKAFYALGGLQTKKRGFGASYTHIPFFTTKKRQVIARGKLRVGLSSIYSR